MEQSKIEEARKYVRKIKNPNKRAYAERFLRYIESNFQKNLEPPPPKSYLSLMAEQAVRMRLTNILCH